MEDTLKYEEHWRADAVLFHLNHVRTAVREYFPEVCGLQDPARSAAIVSIREAIHQLLPKVPTAVWSK